ncbi:glycerol-3-phosphate 1-O-acyltransferase PlsY [Sphingomonas sp. ASY06-1R]|uniref:glycerol-3-phosphate 1-O-acyltransferase PlsY n=1 Tax=Sphingomonas sp. ASY06-1R TaxID=3445771 RepID=UPI003FA29D08
MNGWALPALVLVASYLVGAIPFGVIVTRLAGATDPRSVGSGNIGATNVLRTGRKSLAALTLLLDAGKGAVAVLVSEALVPGTGPLAAVAAFFGHIFPLWLRFKGGKGVATLLGITLAVHWPTGLVALAMWLVAMLLSRRSSVGGMSAAIATPVASAFFFRADLTLMFLALALVVLWRHRDNIVRLIDGSEPRIGKGG